MESLIVAGVMALIGGTINAFASHSEDDDEWDRLSKEKTRLEEAYKLQAELAESEFQNAKDEANRKADKDEKTADLTDLSADISETAVSNDFNTAIDNLYLSQAADAWDWNNAAMQIGSSAGANYAALAGSGVRAGSSVSDAVLMESTLNSAQLQFSQDAKRRQDNNNLAGVLNSLAGNKFDIYQNRVGADITRDDASWLRNSFLEGGSNYNIYQKQKELAELRKNQELARLKDAQDSIEDNRHWKAISAFFGGASKGASAGYNASTTFFDAVDYKQTKLGGK